MTTTRTPARFDLDLAVYRFRKAKNTYENARLGSIAEREAERTMNRIVAAAEASGNLDALIHVLHGKG